MPIVQNVVKTGAQVANTVRDLGRLREILQVLAAHGLGFIVERVKLPDMPIIGRPTPEVQKLPLPERATRAIQQLGPTFVKLGQVFSTRPDLIPLTWCRALETLQDNVSPVPYDAIAEQLTASLGKPPEELFATLEQEPLAAASIAQVHRATLHDGTEVVLKVQRPGLARVIDTDLDILKFLARRVENQFPDLAILDIMGMIRDFEKSIREEMDFTHEAANTERFANNLADLRGIRVPHIHQPHSSREVLCMEFFDGTRMRQARDAGFDMGELGKLYFRAAARMLFEDGFFHGDLHPGNVLVMETEDGPTLGLIDFGMAGHLTEEMRDNVTAVLFGVAQRDFRTVSRVMFEVGVKNTRIDYRRFETEVMELMQRHVVGRSMGEIQVSAFLSELLAGCLRHNISVPSGYTMLFKAIMTTEGLAKDLLPEIDPLEEFRPVLEEAVRQRFGRDRLTRDMTLYMMSADQLMRRLPTIGAQLLSDYEADRLRLPTLQLQNPEIERRIDQRWNRMAGVMTLIALFLGTVLSLGMPQWAPYGVPVISVLLLMGTTGFGGLIGLAVLRSGGIFSDRP